jgi:hypothetical protein
MMSNVQLARDLYAAFGRGEPSEATARPGRINHGAALRVEFTTLLYSEYLSVP